ncbi:MAG TPA: hypothetical protein VN861_02220 [Candidatus Acidoferrales bacterium]|nr:hypothetical protein [Candidatus Acidoferrales bacterium]
MISTTRLKSYRTIRFGRPFLLLVLMYALVPSHALAMPNTTNAGCPAGASTWDFYVGSNGSVGESGRTKEGPVCVQIHYNRLRFRLLVNFDTTQAKGPDLSSVLLTGTVSGAGAAGGNVDETQRAADLQNILAALSRQDRDASAVTTGIDSVKALVAFLDDLIASHSSIPDAVIDMKYKDLRPSLQASERLVTGILVTDSVTGGCPANPATPVAGSILDTLQQYRSDATFYAANKDSVDRATTLANLYRCGAPKQTSLPGNVAVLKFWDERFQEIGLSTGLSDANLSQVQVASFFAISTYLQCGNIFNQSSNTAASLTTYDETATLSGNLGAPSAQQDKGFFTVTCASPFSVSAGVEFSTIPSREFAIVKSAGGTNNTSINTFGFSSQSSFHPLPVAIAHVRLWESQNQKYALHFSAGASGNIQGQNSGGSSAEFITGGSVSFFRTIFVTAGLHVGTKTSLAGGFKIGETVPSDITTVPVTKSYTTGFGLAITFTKP